MLTYVLGLSAIKSPDTFLYEGQTLITESSQLVPFTLLNLGSEMDENIQIDLRSEVSNSRIVAPKSDVRVTKIDHEHQEMLITKLRPTDHIYFYI